MEILCILLELQMLYPLGVIGTQVWSALEVRGVELHTTEYFVPLPAIGPAGTEFAQLAPIF
jgi:hypothetical protein